MFCKIKNLVLILQCFEEMKNDYAGLMKKLK